ncbi:histidine phosphatase family protein [Roseobacter denitrificans]|uniref:Phosphoglycerate mutase, putative n=1 Tax=Roseobacter denitrificans (strain ATCC 33942 / OCh 114) TaxID=375451 RepID=Q16AZ8_ROSDO|nr:histidine phosphatase family protein [Roseobacter denitrificans]ABG30845.1 phosphoglycerate mutase, putative [Roseobacter denitrificans OCh 114]AVL53949.1 histidine phosphatase family protein [Roseobacter denitrificans]SFG15353.1 Broad specificity phosphatase PhoE [Roseobacter denitrificans OCh 114]
MTVWHWVRHGPTHARSFVGWRDVPADLSDTAQIARLRAHLPSDAVLVSSDLARARDTAHALQTPAHHRLPHDPHLREMHFGIWDGMHFEDIAARDPDLSRTFWENPGHVTAPGGESWNTAAARVQSAVTRISNAYPGRDIIAVAHFGVILTQVQRALQISAYDTLSHRIDNFSVTKINWTCDTDPVPYINHLP